ncbi:hypothetical protein ScPMuIL_014885 [Solemya velum]
MVPLRRRMLLFQLREGQVVRSCASDQYVYFGMSDRRDEASGKWDDVRCNNHFRYICEKTASRCVRD